MINTGPGLSMINTGPGLSMINTGPGSRFVQFVKKTGSIIRNRVVS